MKVSLHEESVKVPMLIKVPGKKPAVCHSFSELIDLYPTTAELVGLDYSEHLQGKSLVKTFDNPWYSVRDTAFSVSQGGRSFLLRTDKWAYIQYDEDAGSGIELFNMKTDPEQYTNLALDSNYAKVAEGFQNALAQRLVAVRNNDLEIDYSKVK